MTSPSTMHYDVFISYRRETGREFARMIQLVLENLGYSVFFDSDSVQDGRFDEKIQSAIDGCSVFVAAYSEGSLDRCVNEDDWVRRELERAFSSSRKVVPAAPIDVHANWTFPADLPASLAALPGIQISRIDTGDLFRESIEKMVAKRFPPPSAAVSARAARPSRRAGTAAFRLMSPEEITPRDIQEVLDMEAEIYPENERQELRSCLSYFEANPNVYLFFKDERTGKIAGNIDICPVTDECYGMIRSGRFLDREISPDMVLSYDMPALYNLYYEGITVRREYRNTELFLFMFNSLVDLFRDLGEKEVYARRMVADAVTKEGKKFCKLFGMVKIGESDHGSSLYEVSLIPPRFRVTSKPTKALHDYYARKYEEVRDFLDSAD